MVQEYLNLEEAAEVLGISPDQLRQKAQNHEIRAFADGGSFKFQKKVIEEAARQSGIGSGAEIVFSDEEDQVNVDSGSSDEILLSDHFADDPAGSGARVIGMDEHGRTPSDSDVRLVAEEGPKGGSDSDVKLVAEGNPPSDSDVKLVAEGKESSDSDVKIKGPAPTDSDVRLETRRKAAAQESDSAILPPLSEDSSGSDFEMAPNLEDDSEFELAVDPSSDLDDSGMTLALDDDAGLLADDAAKSPSDSDVTAQAPSSSGLSLDSPIDSGIALDGSADSASSGLKLGDAGSSGDDSYETDFDVPPLDSDSDFDLGTGSDADTAQLTADSDFELSEVDLGGGGGAQEIPLTDDDELADEAAATQLGDVASVEEEAWEEDEEGIDDFDEVDAALPEHAVAGALEDEAEETTEAPVLVPAGAAQPEWGLWSVVSLGVSSFVMIFVAIVMMDLVRTMWGWEDPTQLYSSFFLDKLSGLFPGK